ncbi:MAG: NAD(P)/FAD-dependent oxidoreductase [Eubacteriales bacterium]|nr:NAD(P)/FAD-dependent oxidoreductase [Eubacteriales bacterium]
MTDCKYDVVVVGGGAAGMMAAICAAQHGARTLLLERNEKLGKKLYITGKGRCNLTNDCDRDELMRNTVRNGRFLYSAYATLDNRALMRMVQELGVPLKTERGGRVFPQSDHASDINRALTRALAQYGAQVRLHSRVAALQCDEGRVSGVTLAGGETVAAKAVVLATGGLSYAVTGSDGDGHRMAAQNGHVVTDCTPSLVPIVIQEPWVAQLQGLALKNVRLGLYRRGKRIFEDIGEMLFTHFGVSGPLVLTASATISGQPIDEFSLRLDMKPGLDETRLDQRLLRDLDENANRQIANTLPALLPQRMVRPVLELCAIAPEAPCHQITRAQRRLLGETIKSLALTPTGLRGWDEAVITRGGVACQQVDPSTLQSRVLPGLYFAGELLDVDALTGGFNLQLAFSTGYLAGAQSARASQA